MSDKKVSRFNLHLPGLLEVLAGSLYSTSKVGLRELIQNAHDSCIRRMIETPEPAYRPRIRITTDKNRNILTVADNGQGLSEDDIETYLSTIGRSYTKELKQELNILAPEDATKLIGQFGFGFLSAFLLADSVDLITRSVEPESKALHWSSAGGEQYSITSIEHKDVGTTVILTLKPNAHFVFNETVLTDIIRQYANFLNVPIYLNDDPLPVNIITPPWEAANPNMAVTDYLRHSLGLSEEPLHVIYLTNEEIDLGHDTLEIPLQGFLFVPAGSITSIREYGDLTVYIRRMFICDNQTTLLPPWARFIRGIIDCPHLQPTASRESIYENESFFEVRQALTAQLSRSLQKLSKEDPVTWRKIVKNHSDVIMAWAIRDNDFFSLVADLIHVQTSRGYLTLPEYLDLSPGRLYYVTQFLGSVQEQLLAEGYDVPVINAYWFAVKPFLMKYASWHARVELTEIGKDINSLLRPVSEEGFATLLEFYREQGIPTKLVSFKPRHVPALMIYPADAEFISDAQQSVDKKQLPEAISNFVTDYLEGKSVKDSTTGTLYLNASCNFIQTLAQQTDSIVHFDKTLVLIYQIARLFAGRLLTPADVKSAYSEIIAALLHINNGSKNTARGSENL